MADRGLGNYLGECLHVIECDQDLQPGDAIPCQQCDQPSIVISRLEPDWWYELSCKDCVYTVNVGKSTTKARILGIKHRQKLGHALKLYKVTAAEGRNTF